MTNNFASANTAINEIIKAVDFEFAHDQMINNAALGIQAVMTDDKKDFIVGGKAGPYPFGGMNFIISPIYGHCADSGVDFFEMLTTPQPISIEDASPIYDRIDTVQVRGKVVLYDFQDRKFRDAATGIETVENIPTKKRIAMEVSVKKGINGSATAPTADVGFIKLAEIVVPAASVSINPENIKNITARSADAQNSNWTIDETRTFNPGYVSEIVAMLLANHKEDGSHKNNIITAGNILFGNQVNAVRGSVIPTGESITILNADFNALSSITNVLSALGLGVNSVMAWIKEKLNVTSGHKHTGGTDDAPQIETAGITDASVTAAKLADNAVETAKINARAVTGSKLFTSAAANRVLAVGATASADPAYVQVSANMIADSAVGTAKIAASAVTSEKLASNLALAGTPTAPTVNTIPRSRNPNSAITGATDSPATLNDWGNQIVSMNTLRNALIQQLFPVGAYYTQYSRTGQATLAGMFPVNERPGDLFGGTWTEVFSAEDVFFRTGALGSLRGKRWNDAAKAFEAGTAGIEPDAVRDASGLLAYFMYAYSATGIFKFDLLASSNFIYPAGTGSGSQPAKILRYAFSNDVPTDSTNRPENRLIKVFKRTA